MANVKFATSLFVPATASLREWGAVNVFENRIHTEQWSEDPPLTIEDARHDWSDIPAFSDFFAWTVWATDSMLRTPDKEP